jgi:hypothetical protein
MNRLILGLYGVSILLLSLGVVTINAQQPSLTEKQELVFKFRNLTGADNVKLAINVSLEDVKNNLVETLDADKDLTESQRQELRKSAIEAYNRVDQQLTGFLNDKAQITPLSEAAVFEVYDQAFTEAELRELIGFFSTATGQKVLQFLPTLSAQVQKSFQSMLLPKISEFITPKIKAETDQLKQKIMETKKHKP